MSHMCVTHQHMCTHKTAFPVGRQSAFTYTSGSRGSESPVCSAARGPPPPSAPQEVNSQTAASRLPPRLLSRPSGRPQPLPSILTTHTELRPPVTQFRVRKDRTSVWVLTWMRTQSSGKTLTWNRGCWWDPDLPLTQRQEERTTTKHLLPLPELPLSQGPLSVVKHHSGISICGHLSR